MNSPYLIIDRSGNAVDINSNRRIDTMKITFEQKNSNDRKMTITHERRAFIYECALKNQCPDGTFGDEECLLWEMFRHAYEYGKGERDGIW